MAHVVTWRPQPSPWHDWAANACPWVHLLCLVFIPDSPAASGPVCCPLSSQPAQPRPLSNVRPSTWGWDHITLSAPGLRSESGGSIITWIMGQDVTDTEAGQQLATEQVTAAGQITDNSCQLSHAVRLSSCPACFCHNQIFKFNRTTIIFSTELVK